MAPTISDVVNTITKRQNGGCPSGSYPRGGYCYYNSTWDQWGRWVALVCIVAFVLFIAFAFSCMNARRRRRRGLPPRYGTGFLAGKTPVGHNGPQYNGSYGGQQQGAPAPPYSPPQGQQQQYTGNTFNSNGGYYGQNTYGGQQSGIELQQPQSSYQPQRGGENVYAAPDGPPPGKGYKNDGIIR